MNILRLLSIAILMTGTLGITTTFLPSEANAQSSMSLAQAKDKGFVGEMADGYVGIVNPPGSPDIQQLVATTNAGRMAVYDEAAKRQGVSIITVKALAGKNLREKTPPGQFIYTGGSWERKKVF